MLALAVISVAGLTSSTTLYSITIPCVYIIAKAQATIFNIEPDKLIVAQSGITKLAIERRTPFDNVASNVTGIVAAEDDVPNAVKYAGIIFLKS